MQTPLHFGSDGHTVRENQQTVFAPVGGKGHHIKLAVQITEDSQSAPQFFGVIDFPMTFGEENRHVSLRNAVTVKLIALPEPDKKPFIPGHHLFRDTEIRGHVVADIGAQAVGKAGNQLLTDSLFTAQTAEVRPLIEAPRHIKAGVITQSPHVTAHQRQIVIITSQLGGDTFKVKVSATQSQLIFVADTVEVEHEIWIDFLHSVGKVLCKFPVAAQSKGLHGTVVGRVDPLGFHLDKTMFAAAAVACKAVHKEACHVVLLRHFASHGDKVLTVRGVSANGAVERVNIRNGRSIFRAGLPVGVQTALLL